jgi:exosortase A-associated hydrolase 2
MTSTLVSGHFVDSDRGSIFLLLRQPPAPQGCVLMVPPFGEEMNKCRRMMTIVALALAEKQIASVVVDLYGTGDSGGDFAEADWTTWRSDLVRAWQWCSQRGARINALLATRLGASLAAVAVDSGAVSAVERTVLWQPVFDGARFLNHLLRMRLAALLAEQDRKETMAELRARLKNGGSVEVAGYELSGRLATDLEALPRAAHLPAQFGDIHWIEIVREAGLPVPPPSQQLIDATRAAGGRVSCSVVPGEPFWTTTEIVENAAVVRATVDAFLANSAS